LTVTVDGDLALFGVDLTVDVVVEVALEGFEEVVVGFAAVGGVSGEDFYYGGLDFYDEFCENAA
jgi:hypothetical protein